MIINHFHGLDACWTSIQQVDLMNAILQNAHAFFSMQNIYANFVKVFKVYFFYYFVHSWSIAFFCIIFFLQHSFSPFYAFFRETYHFAFAFSHFCLSFVVALFQCYGEEKKIWCRSCVALNTVTTLLINHQRQD